jgi:hypothetical protein
MITNTTASARPRDVIQWRVAHGQPDPTGWYRCRLSLNLGRLAQRH